MHNTRCAILNAVILLVIVMLSAGNHADAQRDSTALTVTYVAGDSSANSYLQLGNHLQLKGLIQGGYSWNDTAVIPSAFYLRRLRLDFTGNIFDGFSYRLQMDLINAMRILNAEVTYAVAPLLSLHFGMSKVPYCYDNFYNPYTLPTISRAYLDEHLATRASDMYGNQYGRDLGLWVTGTYHLPGNRPLLEYIAGIYNGAGLAVSDNNKQKDVALTLRVSPVKNVWMSGRYFSGTGEVKAFPGLPVERKRYGGDISFENERYLLEAEFLYGLDTGDSIGRSERAGWYITCGYMLISDRLQVVARLDNFDEDYPKDGSGIRSYILAGSWYITKSTRMQLEYNFASGVKNTGHANSLNMQLLVGF